jgi:hypothetical protein
MTTMTCGLPYYEKQHNDCLLSVVQWGGKGGLPGLGDGRSGHIPRPVHPQGHYRAGQPIGDKLTIKWKWKIISNIEQRRQVKKKKKSQTVVFIERFQMRPILQFLSCKG